MATPPLEEDYLCRVIPPSDSTQPGNLGWTRRPSATALHLHQDDLEQVARLEDGVIGGMSRTLLIFA